MTKAERKEFARLQRAGRLSGKPWRRLNELRDKGKVKKGRAFPVALLTPPAKMM